MTKGEAKKCIRKKENSNINTISQVNNNNNSSSLNSSSFIEYSNKKSQNEKFIDISSKSNSQSKKDISNFSHNSHTHNTQQIPTTKSSNRISLYDQNSYSKLTPKTVKTMTFGMNENNPSTICTSTPSTKKFNMKMFTPLKYNDILLNSPVKNKDEKAKKKNNKQEQINNFKCNMIKLNEIESDDSCFVLNNCVNCEKGLYLIIDNQILSHLDSCPITVECNACKTVPYKQSQMDAKCSFCWKPQARIQSDNHINVVADFLFFCKSCASSILKIKL